MKVWPNAIWKSLRMVGWGLVAEVFFYAAAVVAFSLQVGTHGFMVVVGYGTTTRLCYGY